MNRASSRDLTLLITISEIPLVARVPVAHVHPNMPYVHRKASF